MTWSRYVVAVVPIALPGFLAAILVMTALSIQMRPKESLVGVATIAIGWILWRIQAAFRAGSAGSGAASRE